MATPNDQVADAARTLSEIVRTHPNVPLGQLATQLRRDDPQFARWPQEMLVLALGKAAWSQP